MSMDSDIALQYYKRNDIIKIGQQRDGNIKMSMHITTMSCYSK